MPSKTKIGDSFSKLLDASSRPIYAVDAQRQIVYGNAALARWLGLDKSQIIGREVEYHSEPAAEVSSSASGSGPLTSLCPPPTAFAGEPCTGTLACLARDGRLLHRRAEFIPLETRAKSGPTSDTKASAAAPRVGVLVVLGTAEMLPHELASGLWATPLPTTSPLDPPLSPGPGHPVCRTVVARRQPRNPKGPRKAAAAAASGANVLILGRPGSGRGHIARVVHYTSAADNNAKLIPIDCRLLNEDLLRRTLDSLRGGRGDARQRPTLLLENLERLALSLQSQLIEAIRQGRITTRVIAICDDGDDGDDDGACDADGLEESVHPPLRDLLSTITIRAPRLVDRLENLPILAQCFLESSNQGSQRQVGWNPLRSAGINWQCTGGLANWMNCGA